MWSKAETDEKPGVRAGGWRESEMYRNRLEGLGNLVMVALMSSEFEPSTLLLGIRGQDILETTFVLCQYSDQPLANSRNRIVYAVQDCRFQM